MSAEIQVCGLCSSTQAFKSWFTGHILDVILTNTIIINDNTKPLPLPNTHTIYIITLLVDLFHIKSNS